MNSSGSNQRPACDRPHDGSAGAKAAPPERRSLPWRRLRVALTIALAGVAFSLWLALRLHRDALATDQQRFDLECEYVAGLVENTVERYEERLGRLAMACVLDPWMTPGAWAFELFDEVEVTHNMPAVLQVIYCPKVRPEDYESHRARAREILGQNYAFQPPAEAAFALPVWASYTRREFQPLAPGVDLRQLDHLTNTDVAAVVSPAGKVSPPAFLPRRQGPPQVGYWFTLPLFKPDQTYIRKGSPADTVEMRRATIEGRNQFYGQSSLGLLAAFISVDHLVGRTFNAPDRPRHLHVRLYAGAVTSPELLLNTGIDAPPNPRHRRLIKQPWYGKPRTFEFTSTPLFEQQSLLYRGWLAAGFGIPLSLLIASFIGYQSVMHERERAVARDLAESRDSLRHAQTEREKLSRDLHDGAVQSLYALQLGLLNTARRAERESPGTAADLAAARAGLDAVIAELRQFILHQGSAEPKAARTNLADVLHALAQRPHVHQQTQVEIECDPVAAERVSARQAVQLANIAREALSNALRHAGASRIALRLSQGPAEVRLEIEDNGRGFDPNQARTAGQGLANMQRRAEEEGGVLTIASQPETGTRLAVSLPVQAEEPSPAHPETD